MQIKNIFLEFQYFLGKRICESDFLKQTFTIQVQVPAAQQFHYTFKQTPPISSLIHEKTKQRKRMNAKFLFFSDIRLFNKIISAVFRRIC